MRRFVLFVVVAAGLVACGTTTSAPTTTRQVETTTTTESTTTTAVVYPPSTEEPTTTYTVPETTTTQSSNTSADDVFLRVVHNGVPSSVNVTDSTLIALGHSVCNAFDAGLSFSRAVGIIETSGGLSAHDSGYIVGASIGAYCPEHKSLIPGSA